MRNLIEYISESVQKWNEETCRKEAKKYKTIKDFRQGSPTAERKARQNGWIKNFSWLEKSKKDDGYWNEEMCRKEAKKYKTRSEFYKGSGSAYNVAYKNGWLDDYDWFVNGRFGHGKWNEETCREEAKKYKTRSEFQEGSRGAYHVALKNGWLDDYDWFVDGNKIRAERNRKWNEETCREEAKKYKTRSEFQEGSRGAYGVSRKNGWLDSYTWLKDERFDLYKDPIDCVYGYFFDELNAVYIGRTLMRLQKNRDKAHIFNTERDAVAKFAKENDIPVPKMKMIEKDLTIAQGAEREGYWEKYYREHGWTTLNRTKTGSIGGLGKGKWTKETCREEAKKYKTRNEFKKGNKSAYGVARKNGWLDTYDWFEDSKTKKKWNEETCREEAKKYKTRSEFYEGSRGAYNVASKNGWLDTYDWLKEPPKRNFWNEEMCREEAKKYKTRKQFEKGNASAYNVARKNGWLDDYDWFEESKTKQKWNKETCREEAKKYMTRGQFQKGSVGAYKVALKNGWLNTYDWFEESKSAKKWNEETCREEAKKYKTRSEFYEGSRGAYNVASKNGWLDTYDWFEIKRKPKNITEFVKSRIKPLYEHLKEQQHH